MLSVPNLLWWRYIHASLVFHFSSLLSFSFSFLHTATPSLRYSHRFTFLLVSFRLITIISSSPTINHANPRPQNEQLKKAAIIRAEGEAEAARLISEAMRSGPGFIELRRIEAFREIAETLAKSRNVTYLVCSLFVVWLFFAVSFLWFGFCSLVCSLVVNFWCAAQWFKRVFKYAQLGSPPSPSGLIWKTR